METLREFHARVDGFTNDSLPHDGCLVTRIPLTEKVAPDGRMLPFFGNTMIFDLPQGIQLDIARMQVSLHHCCGFMLAEPLTSSALHMTLHDLLNGTDEAALRDGVERTGMQAQRILQSMRSEALFPVRLTSTKAFNMVNGSVALGFAPDTEEDCAVLMGMHARYQQVVALNYPLTPHVTLAYYRPGAYGPEHTSRLAEALDIINALPPVHLTLDAAQLHYYRFEDMNTYLRAD